MIDSDTEEVMISTFQFPLLFFMSRHHELTAEHPQLISFLH